MTRLDGVKMVKSSAAHPKLSFDQANAICREFLPIGDQVFDYMARLRAAGFKAFMPRHAFIESFAESPQDPSPMHHRDRKGASRAALANAHLR
jgi:hypothetical protein